VEPTPATPAVERAGLAARIFNLVCLVGGVVLLVLAVHSIGLARLGELAVRVGPWSAAILAVNVAYSMCDAASQHFFMRPEQRALSYWRMLVVHVSAQAVNLLTPGQKVGEATKVTLLLGHAPRPRVIASIVRFNLTNLAISIVASAIGAGITPFLYHLPHRVEVALLVVAGIGALIARGLHVLSNERRERWAKRLGEIDRLLAHGREPGNGVFLGVSFAIAGRVLFWSELYVILVAMGTAPSLGFIAVVSLLSVALNTIASIVPMGLGLTEGGLYGLFQALGESPDLGVAASLVRRARVMLSAAFGLLLMVAMQTYDRLRLARAQQRVRERHPGGE
jgi:uncharacterized membrane protein YbhN (UPF0104 family)